MLHKCRAMFADVSRPIWLDWALLGTLSVLCFFGFSFRFDMWITLEHGKDLLDAILQGRPFQFYTAVMDKALAGGYGEPTMVNAAAYNIVVYLIFALWAIPLKILSSVFHVEPSVLTLLAYGKLLVVVSMLISAKLMAKLAKKIGFDARWTVFLYLSSPLLLWGALTINQYDIFASVFTVWALLFYMDKKYYRFSLVMAVAICCKMFPLFIFVPLILLAEKRVGRILAHLLVGGSGYLFTTQVLTLRDPGYRLTQTAMESMYKFSQRLFEAVIPSAYDGIGLFLAAALLICMVAYLIKPTDENRVQYAIYLPLSMYGAFFAFVRWHPQWLVILTPLLTLAAMTMRNKKIFVFAEIVVSASCICQALVFSREYNDNYMVNGGILPELFGFSYQGPTLGAYFDKLGLPALVFMSAYAAAMTFMVGLLLYSLHRRQTALRQDQLGLTRSVLWARSALMLGYVIPTIALFFLRH